MTTAALEQKLEDLRERRTRLLADFHATNGAIQLLEWQLAPPPSVVNTPVQVWPAPSQSDGSATYDQRPHV